MGTETFDAAHHSRLRRDIQDYVEQNTETSRADPGPSYEVTTVETRYQAPGQAPEITLAANLDVFSDSDAVADGSTQLTCSARYDHQSQSYQLLEDTRAKRSLSSNFSCADMVARLNLPIPLDEADTVTLPETGFSFVRQTFYDPVTKTTFVKYWQPMRRDRFQELSKQDLEALVIKDQEEQKTKYGVLTPDLSLKAHVGSIESPDDILSTVIFPKYNTDNLAKRMPPEEFRALSDEEQREEITRFHLAMSDSLTAENERIQRLLIRSGLPKSAFPHDPNGAPVLFAHLTPEQVLGLSTRHDLIDYMGDEFEFPGDIVPTTTNFENISCAIDSSLAESNFGLKSDPNVAVLIGEYGTADPSIVTSIEQTMIQPNSYNDHATGSAAIIAAMSPNSPLYSSHINEAHACDYRHMVDWGMDRLVRIYNFSFSAPNQEGYTLTDILLDDYMDLYGINMVAAAGNNDVCGDYKITSPGLALNAITVGSYNSNGNCEPSDDYHNPNIDGHYPSCYLEEQNGGEKPDIMAPTNIYPLIVEVENEEGEIEEKSFGLGGASGSSALVAGAVAQLASQDLNIEYYGELTRAILMASAFDTQNDLGDPEISGSGGVNIAHAHEILLSGNWDIITGAGWQGDTQTYSIVVPPGSDRMKVAASWMRSHNWHECALLDGFIVAEDANLFLYDADGILVDSAIKYYETTNDFIDVSLPKSGSAETYTLEVSHSYFCNPYDDYIAIAWAFSPFCQSSGFDGDGDAVCSDFDNCWFDPNADQLDSDGDGFGDVCDECENDHIDEDGDGVGEGLGPGCDNCEGVKNPDQENIDGDEFGDACDFDDDGDGCPDDTDQDPQNAEERIGWFVGVTCSGDVYEDASTQNKDGIAYCATDDNDGDGIPDDCDPCPIHAAQESKLDCGDGTPDDCGKCLADVDLESKFDCMYVGYCPPEELVPEDPFTWLWFEDWRSWILSLPELDDPYQQNFALGEDHRMKAAIDYVLSHVTLSEEHVVVNKTTGEVNKQATFERLWRRETELVDETLKQLRVKITQVE